MPSLRMDVPTEVYDRIVAEAKAEMRPIQWHAVVLLRKALGLPFPLPVEPKPEPKKWMDDEP